MRLPIQHLAMLVLLCAGLPVQAQMFKDPALDALYSAERFDEVGRAGTQRLAANADDAQALLAAAIGALRGSDAARREAVIAHAEACVQRQPQAAVCHYTLGAVLGVHAASLGMMKLAASVGRVKAALQEALTLEPQWYAARSAVVEFYSVAPALVGGSIGKAQETARGAPRPEQARALQARVLLQEGQPEAALAALAAVQPGNDSALANDVTAWSRAAAFALLSDKQPEKARAYFERAARERPELAVAPYGLGRVLSETGAPAEALKQFELAARLRGAGDLPIAYRTGIAQQALGQKEAARESLQRFVAAGRGSKGNLDDAKKRLEQLGA
jgi:tetratricopeptide (TPR) repeat protein